MIEKYFYVVLLKRCEINISYNLNKKGLHPYYLEKIGLFSVSLSRKNLNHLPLLFQLQLFIDQLTAEIDKTRRYSSVK